MKDVTQLLNAIEAGDAQAAAQLLPLVYDELRRLAAAQLAREKPGQTLDATALVHEAYLRLVGTPSFASKSHFFRAAAEVMRRILVDQARKKRAEKRGRGAQRFELSEADRVVLPDPNLLLTIDEALAQLATEDTASAEVARLRLFAGLSIEEAADALKLREETLALQKAKLGPDHPDTLRSMNNLAISYYALGRHAEALKLSEEARTLQKAKLGPDHSGTAWTMNNLAWFLVTASDVKLWDLPRALELAKRAAELSPQESAYWGTYGTVRYRTGDWKGAIADLEKAIGLRTPDAPDNANEGFFLAMAYWQLGEQDKARDWFDKSVQWMEKGNKENAELQRFRAEAAELLGAEKKD